VYALAGIAFFLAIAFFVYLVWKERRDEIGAWPTQAKLAFYGGALLVIVALGAYFVGHPTGPDALAFVLVLGLSGFAMWRVWRDQHTYGY
jgi:protein-S-isoprenylcysteine O-methyltransferase Ste14